MDDLCEPETATDFYSAQRAETTELRTRAFDQIEVEPTGNNVIRSTDGRHALYWNRSRFTKLDECYDEVKLRRWKCAVYDDMKRKVAVGDFTEIKANKPLSDEFWNMCMDDVSSHLQDVAFGFTLGWPAESLAQHGNLSVLELVAAMPDAGPATWVPLLERFISEKLFEQTFVLIGDIYPYDFARAREFLATDDPERRLAERRVAGRWATKLRFFEEHMGLEGYKTDDGRLPKWVYRLRDAGDDETYPDFGREWGD